MSIEALGGLSAAIIGFVGVFTQAGMPTKFAPILACVFGIISVCLLGHSWGFNDILVGLMTGLTAVGIHAGTGATKDLVVDAFANK